MLENFSGARSPDNSRCMTRTMDSLNPLLHNSSGDSVLVMHITRTKLLKPLSCGSYDDYISSAAKDWLRWPEQNRWNWYCVGILAILFWSCTSPEQNRWSPCHVGVATIILVGQLRTGFDDRNRIAETETVWGFWRSCSGHPYPQNKPYDRCWMPRNHNRVAERLPRQAFWRLCSGHPYHQNKFSVTFTLRELCGFILLADRSALTRSTNGGLLPTRTESLQLPHRESFRHLVLVILLALTMNSWQTLTIKWLKLWLGGNSGDPVLVMRMTRTKWLKPLPVGSSVYFLCWYISSPFYLLEEWLAEMQE